MASADLGLPPRAPWDLVAPDLMEAWEGGMHFSVLAPTGAGKTVMKCDLDLRRTQQRDRARGVVLLCCKPRDKVLVGWAAQHRIPILPSWDQVTYQVRKRRIFIIWPPYGRASTAGARNRPIFLEAMDRIIAEGDWTVDVDDLPYFIEQLKLRVSFDEFYNNGRSDGLSLLAGMQRPVWINRSAVSQTSFVAAAKPRDLEDAERVAELMGNREFARAPRGARPPLMRLPRHVFWILETNTDKQVTTKLPKPPPLPTKAETPAWWKRAA